MIIINESEDKLEFERDAANFVGHATTVYLPQTIDEIADIVKQHNAEQIPLTISAARTGLTGGGVPQIGNLISTERLDKIIKIDIANKTALLEPGVRLQNFHDELTSLNLMYPSNPTETWSTIGGNVANNASGAKTFKYGSTRNFVNYLEIVLADGDEIHIRRGECFADGYNSIISTINNKIIKLELPRIHIPDTTKNAAGYYIRENMDMIDLFIGSEGTLGVIKLIGLDLLDEPHDILSAIVFFDVYNNLLNFAEHFRNEKNVELRPRLIEYFDHNSLKLLSNQQSDIPENAIGAVWVEFELGEDKLDDMMTYLYELSMKYTDIVDLTWVASTENERKKITQFRHNLPLAVNELLTKYGQQKIYTDTAVPADKFRHYYNEMYKQLNTIGLDYVVFGHIGDCHLHANLFVKNEEDKAKALQFYNNMVNLALEYKGTFSAEHGVGKIKRPFMAKMYLESEIEGMKSIKRKFDPNDLIGRNTIFFDREL